MIQPLHPIGRHQVLPRRKMDAGRHAGLALHLGEPAFAQFHRRSAMNTSEHLQISELRILRVQLIGSRGPILFGGHRIRLNLELKTAIQFILNSEYRNELSS